MALTRRQLFGRDAHSGLRARLLKRALTRTLALVQRRDKSKDAAHAHVREALLTLLERA